MTPIACQLSALSPEERAHYFTLRHAIAPHVQAVNLTPDGLTFSLVNDPALRPILDQWLGMERACCPFLTIRLEAHAEHDSTTLALGGSEAAKSFVLAEFEDWMPHTQSDCR